MSKFKNKKALTLAVGAIMAGVSVIGVVAACAPTKAKPNKPSQGTQNQPQTGGSESSNQGSGSTTTGTKHGSETGGPTDGSGGQQTQTQEVVTQQLQVIKVHKTEKHQLHLKTKRTKMINQAQMAIMLTNLRTI